jgi:hypothetical protein
MGGGIGRIIKAASSFQNPITAFLSGAHASSSEFRLPGQPDFFQISTDDINNSATPQDITTQDIDSGTRTSDGHVSASETYGNPSPYVGKIHLDASVVRTDNVHNQYMTLYADSNNSAPITLSGWSLQSAVSGVRYVITGAARTFYAGDINVITPIRITPGGTAYIISGRSPVGASFQENICSGYLAKHQNFTPDISVGCPDPIAIFPETADNLHTYGASCLDYISSLGSCESPTAPPPSVSLNCKNYIANTLTYNGCINAYSGNASFLLNTWYVYLGAFQAPWDSSHDIVRLLDDQNRIVDSVTY